MREVSDDVVGAALAWARELADHSSPTAMAVIKAQLLLADGQDLDAAVESSLVEMRAAFRRPDLIEAITAKLEKRAPQFPPRRRAGLGQQAAVREGHAHEPALAAGHLGLELRGGCLLRA